MEIKILPGGTNSTEPVAAGFGGWTNEVLHGQCSVEQNHDAFDRVRGWDCDIIIMYIYHALINALSAHMIHINLNMIFYTHLEHSPTKTIYIKYY